MIVRIGLGPRKLGTDRDDFLAHWTETHAKLGALLVGLRRYVQNRPVKDAQPPWLQPVGFDYCSEVSFDTLDDMAKAFESDHYRSNVFADERNLIDHTRQSRVTTERVVLVDGAAPINSIKLITFLRLHPASCREELVASMTGPYAAVVAETKPARHEQLFALTGIDVGHPQACEAVDEIWFRSYRQAISHLQSNAWLRGAEELEGRAFGAMRFLCKPITIVDNSAQTGQI